MEVVKSGDELEKQILEDARTKASRVLADADRECAAIREEWRRKSEAEIRRLEADRDARLSAMRQEMAAALPLDFLRARLSHTAEAVNRALEQYFASLAPGDVARVVGRLLRRVPPVFRDVPATVSAFGIKSQEARRIVEENVPGIRVEAVKDMGQEGGGDRGLVLESTDGRIRYRGTLRELGRQLLDQKREELATALLGRDV